MVRKNRYPNLSVEMARACMSIQDLAESIGMTRQNLWSKIRGLTTWNLGDMIKVQKVLRDKSGDNERLTLDYLFESDGC